MKTLTPEQRIEGFTELEGVLGEGGVGGAHLMSFLAGISHAEKVLAEPERDEEPIYQISLATGRATSSAWIDVTKDQYDDAGMYPEYARRTLYPHPAPRKPFVRLSDEEIMDIYMKWVNDENGKVPLGRAIEDALEEKNK